MVLLAFTFIVTSRQYIGAAIMCVHTEDIPKEVLNTYCWIHPTYTLSSAHWKRVGVDVPHPGVDKTRDERDKKHVKYYQWVGFCLFFQVGHRSTNPSFVFLLALTRSCFQQKHTCRHQGMYSKEKHFRRKNVFSSSSNFRSYRRRAVAHGD